MDHSYSRLSKISKLKNGKKDTVDKSKHRQIDCCEEVCSKIFANSGNKSKATSLGQSSEGVSKAIGANCHGLITCQQSTNNAHLTDISETRNTQLTKFNKTDETDLNSATSDERISTNNVDGTNDVVCNNKGIIKFEVLSRCVNLLPLIITLQLLFSK